MARRGQRLEVCWRDLEGRCTAEVLHAPKTSGDQSSTWPPVHARVVRYLIQNVVGRPWADHLILMAAVLSARRLDVASVKHTLYNIHARFADIFPALDLAEVGEWNPDSHLVAYMRGDIAPDHSQYTRNLFLTRYRSTAKLVRSWFDALPDAEQQIYRPFVLPEVNMFLYEELSQSKQIVQHQRAQRKTETEAIVPHFADLRAEAHYRFNRLARLRQAYLQAITQVLPDRSNLPLDFSYDEGDPPQERMHCRLWDRRCFVLDPKHVAMYSPNTRGRARNKRENYADEHNEIFLELVKVERLSGDAPPEGFWFAELLTIGVVGSATYGGGNEQEVLKQRTWLRQWGYEEEGAEAQASPFLTKVPGLLSWVNETTERISGQGRFIAEARRRTGKLFVPVDSLYAAANFGLLGLDLLTTTGMRSNELQQVSVQPECLVRLVDDPPPGAKDQTPRIRYVLRLLPKGERTETRHNYGIGKETVRLIEKTAQMLCDHYKLRLGEPLPRVAFDPNDQRSHRFEGTLAPYIFQYSYQHLSDIAITACLRFLLHGMVFQTSEGAPVVIKMHLLRHAFATFAVHVEGLPVDLVAKWLQQKNLEVTGYYSEMPEYMQQEQHTSFVARLATQINVREAILRSPQELQKQAETAMKRVGMLVPVCGGDCTIDVYCPNQYDCIHCPAKVPDPEKRSQVEEKRRWAEERLSYYEREGLVLEAEKMRQLLRACDLELREMNLILAYRKDAERAALIQIEPRKRRP